MAAKWRLTGDYFENCNCDVVCPCLVSTAAPLTARPTQGVCDVPLVFHIDKGDYDGVALDGLNVAVVAHTPGPMADGNWTLAAYIDERADEKQTAALGAIFGGGEGGPMAAFAPLVGKHLGVKKVAIKYSINGKIAIGRNSRHHAFGGRAASQRAPQRRDLGRGRSSGRARQARLRRGRPGQHVCRSRHALGQFRQERPLRADQLVELAATRSATENDVSDLTVDRLLLRDRWIVGGCVALITVLAWVWLWREAQAMAPDEFMPGMEMPGAAMVSPSDAAAYLCEHVRHVAPDDGRHDAAVRRADDPVLRRTRARRPGKGAVLAPTSIFAAMYLAVWGGFLGAGGFGPVAARPRRARSPK